MAWTFLYRSNNIRVFQTGRNRELLGEMCTNVKHEIIFMRPWGQNGGKHNKDRMWRSGRESSG